MLDLIFVYRSLRMSPKGKGDVYFSAFTVDVAILKYATKIGLYSHPEKITMREFSNIVGVLVRLCPKYLRKVGVEIGFGSSDLIDT